MFSIEALLKIEELAPLKKVYEKNPNDRRIVVVAGPSGDVNVEETKALHAWLEQQQYRVIPQTWETGDLDELPVIHISQLSVAVLRANPFSILPQPLTPNSWLNKLDQDRFDAILLAQEMGDVERQPTQREIRDNIKPALEAEKLSDYWRGIMDLVKLAKSGAAPRNPREKALKSAWQRVESRRHYDSTAFDSKEPVISNPRPEATVVRHYYWGDSGRMWTPEMTDLRDHILLFVDSTSDVTKVASEVMGGYGNIHITGKLMTDVHALVGEARKRNKLDELASHFNYEPQTGTISTGGGAFNQTGQRVHGNQYNVSVGAGARGVAVGGNIVQTTIITGDNNH